MIIYFDFTRGITRNKITRGGGVILNMAQTHKSMAPQMSELGAKPELKWLLLEQLQVDNSYQRDTQSSASRASIRYLKRNFCWANCGALIVCKDEDKYNVIDGQHRLEAARGRGDIQTLPCIVISDMNIQNQALSFVQINRQRVSLTPMARFHAAVAAGDTLAVHAQGILDTAQIKVPRSPVFMGHTKPREMQAVGTLLTLVKAYSAEIIVWALQCIPEAYGDEVGQMRSHLIKALVMLRYERPDMNQKTMISVLEDVDPVELEVKSQAQARSGGGRTVELSKKTLATLYARHSRRAA